VSVAEIAALVAAIVFAVLVALLAVPILKLGRRLDQLQGTIDETTRLIANVNTQATPLLGQVNQTVGQVNGQLERVDAITANAQSVTTNVSALTALFASTLGSPVVKVAAFSYGVRKAAAGRRRAETGRRVTQQMKSDRRSRRRGGN